MTCKEVSPESLEKYEDTCVFHEDKSTDKSLREKETYY